MQYLAIEILSSSLDSLVKNLNKGDFSYLSQKFDKNKLGIVKQKGFHPSEYETDFEKFKQNYEAKKHFTVRQLVKKRVTKNMIVFLMFGINLK